MRYTQEEAARALSRLEETVARIEKSKGTQFNESDIFVIEDFLKFWRTVMALRFGFKAAVTSLGLLAGLVASVLYLFDKFKGLW